MEVARSAMLHAAIAKWGDRATVSAFIAQALLSFGEDVIRISKRGLSNSAKDLLLVANLLVAQSARYRTTTHAGF
jgi:hypothetical protein